MDRTITEDELRQLREETERLYAEALALMREAAVANRRYRTAMLAAYSVEVNDADKEHEQCIAAIDGWGGTETPKHLFHYEDDWGKTEVPKIKLSVVPSENAPVEDGVIEFKSVGIGEIAAPITDLHIVGVVVRIEEPTYHYGDINGEHGRSLLALPLLHLFEGKRVEVSVRVKRDDDEEGK